MNAFIASDKIVFAAHLQIRNHTADEPFIGSDERVLCWGQTLWRWSVLKTNVLKTNVLC